MTNKTICKNCGHTKGCHRGVDNNACLYVKESNVVPTKDNICGCKDFKK